MARPRFRDSATVNPLATYEWEVGHNEESSGLMTYNLERTAVTTGVGYVRQQGAPTPKTLDFSGSILTQAQYDAMVNYYKACETRTIFYRDVDNTEYEVLITSFNPTRIRVAFNSRSPGLLWKWKYQITMEILS